MSTSERHELDAYQVVAERWPYDGPYDPDTTREAAVAVERLVRYLNNATTKPTALEYAAAAGGILSGLRSAVHMLPQLLRQLEDFALRQADDLTLYDDRRDRPGRATAVELAVSIAAARPAAAGLAAALDEAAELAHHLGND